MCSQNGYQSLISALFYNRILSAIHFFNDTLSLSFTTSFYPNFPNKIEIHCSRFIKLSPEEEGEKKKTPHSFEIDGQVASIWITQASEVHTGWRNVCGRAEGFITRISINHAGSKCVLVAAGQTIRGLDQISRSDHRGWFLSGSGSVLPKDISAVTPVTMQIGNCNSASSISKPPTVT